MGKSLLNYSQKQVDEYKKQLNLVCSLSNLFSTSSAPMIYYRATENIYCKAFNATNVSRSDCTADAIYDFKTGVGIKTFLKRASGSYQKIAEFDKQISLYQDKKGIDLVNVISSLKNDRIDFAMRNYGLKAMIYHCILRDSNGQIDVFEESMHCIDISNIKILSDKPNRIEFTDGIERYLFNYSKSTLFKFFRNTPPFLSFVVNVLSDPLEMLSRAMDLLEGDNHSIQVKEKKVMLPSLIIPLYSESKSKGKFVAAKSGLNQWNGVRTANRTRKDGTVVHVEKQRDENELYIPFSKKLRTVNKGFFPDRNTPWNLQLPNGKTISMKICQEDGKALMSKPNKDLEKWILRDVLHVEEGHLVTYDDLLKIGIDSIIFLKHPNGTYSCDFIVNENDSTDLDD